MAKKRKEYEWIPRAIVYAPFNYALAISEKGFNAIQKHMGIKKDKYEIFMEGNTAGKVVTFYRDTGILNVVCVDAKSGDSPERIRSTLTHEAVHIYQDVKEGLCEVNPSQEFEAYAIQSIVDHLIDSYEYLTSKKSKKGTK